MRALRSGGYVLALGVALGVTGCTLGPKAVPETISLEGGTSVRHEVDQPAVKQNTALVKVLWRLR